MNKIITSAGLSLKIWLLTSAVLGVGCSLWFLLTGQWQSAWIGVLTIIFGLILSIPVLIILLILIPVIEKRKIQASGKLINLLSTCFICTIP
jgi:hypothetical protein